MNSNSKRKHETHAPSLADHARELLFGRVAVEVVLRHLEDPDSPRGGGSVRQL